MYSSPSIIGVIKSEDDMSRFRAHMEGSEKCIQNFGQKLPREIPLERPKHGREDNIEVCLRDIGCEDIDWTHVIQDMLQ
jgi:hypothetical protein